MATRILKPVLLFFICLSLGSCIEIYKETKMNLDSPEFNAIWKSHLSNNIGPYSSKDKVLGYGYTEIHYYDWRCREMTYDNNVFEALSEDEQMYWLYRFYSDISEHSPIGRRTDDLMAGIGHTTRYPDPFFSEMKYYNKKGEKFIAYSSLCTLTNQQYVYYVLFRDEMGY